VNVRLPEYFRAQRALTIPVTRDLRMNVGWECRRPFANLQRRDVDPDCGYVSWFTSSIAGGCKVWQGKDCAIECDGCLAFASSFQTAWDALTHEQQAADDEMTFDDPRCVFFDADMLGETIGHHPSRCGHLPTRIEAESVLGNALIGIGVDDRA
jgi:hypothetical protein